MVNLHCLEVLSLYLSLLAQYEAVHRSRAHPVEFRRPPQRIHIHLSPDEHLIVPKNSRVTRVKILRGSPNPIKSKPVVVPADAHFHHPVKPSALVVLAPSLLPVDKKPLLEDELLSNDDFGKLLKSSSDQQHIKNSFGGISSAGFRLLEHHQEGQLLRTINTQIGVIHHNNNNEGGPPRFDEIKPVVEHIKNDLKYDFRTKTHSI